MNISSFSVFSIIARNLFLANVRLMQRYLLSAFCNVFSYSFLPRRTSDAPQTEVKHSGDASDYGVAAIRDFV